MAVVASYVKINAFDTTATDANAIFPVVAVVKSPVGISVICPPFVNVLGGVIVVIAVVPDTNEIIVVGAIVVALAMVGVAAPDATGAVIVRPAAVIAAAVVTLVRLALPNTISFEFKFDAPYPIAVELDNCVVVPGPAFAPNQVLLLPVVFALAV